MVEVLNTGGHFKIFEKNVSELTFPAWSEILHDGSSFFEHLLQLVQG